MAIETERKYLEVDFDRLRARLKELGAVSRGPHFEENILLDTPDFLLRGQDKLLRLRSQEWPNKREYRLTFKKPLLPAALAAMGCQGRTLDGVSCMKKKEELEFVVSSLEEVLLVFENLGYRVFCKYEKIRESFTLDILPEGGEKSGKVEVDLDKLYFMNVAEIEGEESGILQAEKLLGLDNFKKSSTNYHKLHQDWLREQGLQQKTDILFDAFEKKRLRIMLGLE